LLDASDRAENMTQQDSAVRKDIDFHSMVRTLPTTAKKGLAICYSESTDLLPLTCTRGVDNAFKLVGYSIRNAAISQIGVAEWLRFHPEDAQFLPDLWSKILEHFDEITYVGDFALALWAGVTSKADNCQLFARALATNWERQANLCNAVELGWIVQACTLAAKEQDNLESHVRPVLDEARNRLIGLFRPQQNLFQRHNRSGIREVLSRHITCFADQVYAILALSNYSVLFSEKESAELVAEATEKICQLQGPLGQWWWHYDTTEGKVCEEYPVFSVHQDSMAPMAIMASDRLTGQNHYREIERGLRWLYGNNELNHELVLDGAGIIWRDIEKREVGKISRILRALLCVAGCQFLHSFAGKCFAGFRVNYECRPYHLGWILYAWADYHLRS